FLCALTIVADTEHATLNMLRVAVTFAVMMITYFTSLLTGLVLNVLLIFGYATYLIISVLAYGAVIDGGAYIFMAACPALTAATSVAFRRVQLVEDENAALQKKLISLAAFDEKTGAKTRRSFESDLSVYRALSERYGYSTMLLLWQFRFPAEMKQMLGARQFKRAATKVSRTSLEAFRKTDAIYLLSEEPYLWGALLATREDENEHTVIDRAREKLDMLDIRDVCGERSPNVQLRFSAKADDQTLSPEALIHAVLGGMEYDV
ncbi:MAG: hypothetical protein PHC80_08675, partial [Eubacteriales bacterium]|nr:hypothetical protein [Eubacteriales bacterium]